MKRLLLLIAALLTAAAPATALANYGWVQYSPGYYVWAADPVGYPNDGWIYTRICNYCGQYSYSRLQPTGDVPAATYNANTSYTINENTFETDLVNALAAEKKHAYHLQALRESGLEIANSAQYGYNGSQAAYGIAGSYVNTLTQGFSPTNPQGSTFWSATAAPSISYADTRQEIHDFQSVVRENNSAAAGITNSLGALVDHKASMDGAQNAAIVAETLRNNRILALGLASQTSSTSTTTGSYGPTYPAGTPPTTPPPANPPQDRPAPPAAATPQTGADTGALQQAYLTAGWQRMNTFGCIKCHGGDPAIKLGGGADFTALDAMTDKDRGALAQEAWDRMHLPAADPKHMPKATGGAAAVMVPEDQANNIATKILGKTGPAKPAEAPTPPPVPEKK